MSRKVIVLMSFIFFFLGHVFCSPAKIKEIEVVGNKTVPEKKIIKASEIKKGDEYSEELVTKGLQNIYQLGFFEDITVEVTELPDGVKVTYIVIEKPVIKRIEFKGNKKFSSTKLRDEIESKEKDPFDKRKVDQDIEKIVTLYKEKGYANVKVEAYTSEDEKTGTITLTFFISEGKQIRVARVSLVGVEAFPPNRLEKKLKTKRKKFFKQELLDEDKKILEKYYKERGYLKVNIGTPIFTYNEQQTEIYVTFFIYEGQSYSVGAVSFRGNSVFTSSELEQEVVLKKGEIFSQSKFEATITNVQERYAEKGYILVRLNPDYHFDDDRRLVDIVISITEGGIVYINEIVIEGNVITRDYVIRREFLVKEGDPFNVKKIRRTQEKLYNLGYFSEVGIDIGGTDDPHRADLICKVTEQRTGLLSMGAGYSSQEGLVGTLQVTQSNLFGRGQRLDLILEFGKKRTNYQVSFTEPWLLRKHVLFGVDIFNTDRDRVYYRERRTGGDIRVGPYLSDILGLNFTYGYERVKIYDVDTRYISETEARTWDTSSFTTSLVRDTRDNIFDASRGSRNSISFQFSGGILGGDTNFVKTYLSSSWFLPTFWRFVLALQLRYGIVTSFPPSTGVPVYQRFYVGGADSVRGYDYRGEIGPEEGGVTMFVSNVEYKFPIVREKGQTVLQGAIFLDIGGSWRKGEFNFTIGEGEDQLKVGVGGGLRFQTPIFPVRLDWGYGLNHRKGEDKSQWYFTFGQPF